jgi:hypothetical protein
MESILLLSRLSGTSAASHVDQSGAALGPDRLELSVVASIAPHATCENSVTGMK